MSIKASSFKHGIAAYPKRWRGCHLSPEKICIQFEGITAKTRVHNHDTSDLGFSYEQQHYMPIQHTGTDVEFLAVGVPLEMHIVMLMELIGAYELHMHHYPSTNLREGLVEAHKRLSEVLGLTSP